MTEVAAVQSREVAVIDLLDKLLQGGVVIQGQLTLCAADIELVALDLRVIVAAIDKLAGRT
jgi:hypothetical protein